MAPVSFWKFFRLSWDYRRGYSRLATLWLMWPRWRQFNRAYQQDLADHRAGKF